MAEHLSEKGIRSGNDHEIMDSYHEPGEGINEDAENGNHEVDAKDMYRMGKDQQFRVSALDPQQWLEGMLIFVAYIPTQHDDNVHLDGTMYLGGHFDASSLVQTVLRAFLSN
jgi:hypothetical protein